MSEMTQWTIRTVVSLAAAVAIAWLIFSAIRYHIDTNSEVQKACIAEGASWISGQCIHVGGAP